ncbi:immunity 22 family protein [Pseudomonas sp. SDO52101_S400]
MEVTKTVSIWTAKTGWEPSTLQKIMLPAYSEDGDSLGCEFTNAFSLGFIDNDFIEADTVGNTSSLESAIEGFSYDSDISSDIKSKNIQPTSQTIDTLIAIYDFTFQGNPSARVIRGKEITFRGTFTYKE